jgi:hypothetical protein
MPNDFAGTIFIVIIVGIVIGILLALVSYLAAFQSATRYGNRIVSGQEPLILDARTRRALEDLHQKQFPLIQDKVDTLRTHEIPVQPGPSHPQTMSQQVSQEASGEVRSVENVQPTIPFDMYGQVLAGQEAQFPVFHQDVSGELKSASSLQSRPESMDFPSLTPEQKVPRQPSSPTRYSYDEAISTIPVPVEPGLRSDLSLGQEDLRSGMTIQDGSELSFRERHSENLSTGSNLSEQTSP